MNLKRAVDSVVRSLLSRALGHPSRWNFTHGRRCTYSRAELHKAGKSWGNIETAFDRGDLSWLGWGPSTGDYDQKRFENIFDLWMVAKLKVASLKPEIPAKALWGQFKDAPALYDAELDRLMTFFQFQFLNRHMSFAYTPGAEADDSEDSDSDSGREYRVR